MSVKLPSISFIVPAAGKGLRMGAEIPKQYLKINGQSILEHTLQRLLSVSPRSVVLVVSADDESWQDISCTRDCIIALGGESRADSVLNGLLALQLPDDDWVLVHDCVRPCVRTDDIKRLFDSLESHAVGGLLGLPVSDTLKQVSKSNPREVLATQPREDYWLAQTPQMFRSGLLCRALQQNQQSSRAITDEASAVEMSGLKPVMVQGSKDNIKITTQEDLLLAAYYLQTQTTV